MTTAKTAAAPATPALTLPEEKSAPVTDLSGYSMLLYGEPKCGKTSLAAEFPENFFFMFEPGARALSVYQREVRTWVDFKGYVRLIASTNRFRTLTLDTMDLAYQMCLEHVCKEHGWEHPSDGEYGKGWNAVKAEFLGQISYVLKLGRGVIFTSHATEKDIKTRIGEEYTRIVPTMPNGARDICEAMVDMWIYMYHEKGERIMRIRGNEQIAAGHRLQGHHFQGLEVVPAGTTARVAYNNLVAAFNNQPIGASVAPKSGLSLKK